MSIRNEIKTDIRFFSKYTFTCGKALVYINMDIDYAKFAVECGFTSRVFLFRVWDPGKVAIRFYNLDRKV